MTAPDQYCINVKKLLSIRRRPHMTHSSHRLDRNPAAQQFSPPVLMALVSESCETLEIILEGNSVYTRRESAQDRSFAT